MSVYLDEWRGKKARAGKGVTNEPKTPPGIWSEKIKEYQWLARADAWDRNLTKLAETKIEQLWAEKIMSRTEALGRMSEMGRTNIDEFVKLGKDGEIVAFNAQALKERGFLVKKISTSRGKTNSNSIELYDAQSAVSMMGKHHGAFEGAENEPASAGTRTLAVPADVLAPPFLAPLRDIRGHAHTEYVFYGGRGSTKSSFISLAIIWQLITNPTMHAVALRQVADTLRDSVYAQLTWAIEVLEGYYPGLAKDFKRTTSPLEITYLPTGQKIYFRGADDPGKIKSIKPAFGYIGIAWFEELDQFHGPEAVRKIEQSAIRGGETAFIFKSFNPPPTAANWANKYVKVPKESQYKHFSSYIDVPPEWLGKPWLDEAEFLKGVNPKAYEHEYLGIPSSAGGLVFENVQLRAITDDEIAQFDHVLHGLDWGFYPDPAHYGRCHYDAARRTLYLFGEYRGWKLNNRALYDEVIKAGYKNHQLIIADSAEPKSVADFREYGATIRGAEKGPDSVKYSIKWLQGLSAIIIDPARCPYAAEEFIDYEYEQDPDGNFISEYPDKNNHAIDQTRYATNLIWRRRGQ